MLKKLNQSSPTKKSHEKSVKKQTSPVHNSIVLG